MFINGIWMSTQKHSPLTYDLFSALTIKQPQLAQTEQSQTTQPQTGGFVEKLIKELAWMWLKGLIFSWLSKLRK